MGEYFDVFAKKGRHQYETFGDSDDMILGSAKLMEHSFLDNPLAIALRNKLANEWKGYKIYHLGDYADMDYPTKEETTYVSSNLDKDYRYVINTQKREYIDTWKTPFTEYCYRIDSTLLLTASSEGDGGGYYGRLNSEHIGRWFGNTLEASNSIDEYKNFSEIYLFFSEGYRSVRNWYNIYYFEDYITLVKRITSDELDNRDLKCILEKYVEKPETKLDENLKAIVVEVAKQRGL